MNRGSIVVKQACQQRKHCCQGNMSTGEALLSRKYVNRGSIVVQEICQQRKHCCQRNMSTGEAFLSRKYVNRAAIVVKHAFQQRNHCCQGSIFALNCCRCGCASLGMFQDAAACAVGHWHIFADFPGLQQRQTRTSKFREFMSPALIV